MHVKTEKSIFMVEHSKSAKYGTPDNENGRYWVLNIQNASKETADIKVLWRDFHQFQSFQAQYG